MQLFSCQSSRIVSCRTVTLTRGIRRWSVVNKSSTSLAHTFQNTENIVTFKNDDKKGIFEMKSDRSDLPLAYVVGQDWNDWIKFYFHYFPTDKFHTSIEKPYTRAGKKSPLRYQVQHALLHFQLFSKPLNSLNRSVSGSFPGRGLCI